MDSFWFLGKTFLGCQTGKKLGEGLHPNGQGKTLYLQFFISKCSIKRESGFYSQEEIHLKFSQAKGKTGLCGWKIIIIMDIFLLYFCYKLFLLKCNQWPKKQKTKKKYIFLNSLKCSVGQSSQAYHWCAYFSKESCLAKLVSLIVPTGEHLSRLQQDRIWGCSFPPLLTF